MIFDVIEIFTPVILLDSWGNVVSSVSTYQKVVRIYGT